MFVIIDNVSGRHIGNMKLGPVHLHYKFASTGHFIENKGFWRRGNSNEVMQLIVDYGFSELGLNRVEAGIYSPAIGSWKSCEKVEFVREGVFRQQVFLNGQPLDIYRYSILRYEWEKGARI